MNWRSVATVVLLSSQVCGRGIEYPPSFLWARSLTSGGGFCLTGLAVDDDHNSYVSGQLCGGSKQCLVGELAFTNSGSFITKIDGTGKQTWVIQDATWPAQIYALEVDAQGNLYVVYHVGHGYKSTTVAGLVIALADADVVLLAKYDPRGRPLWTTVGGRLTNFHRSELSIDGSGNCFWALYAINGLAKFGEIPLTNGVVLARYDSDGKQSWFEAELRASEATEPPLPASRSP